jgi:hypothetical protein
MAIDMAEFRSGVDFYRYGALSYSITPKSVKKAPFQVMRHFAIPAPAVKSQANPVAYELWHDPIMRSERLRSA